MVKRERRVPIREAARVIGVAPQTLYNWKNIGRHKGRLKFRRASSGRIYVYEGVLKKFAEWYKG